MNGINSELIFAVSIKSQILVESDTKTIKSPHKFMKHKYIILSFTFLSTSHFVPFFTFLLCYCNILYIIKQAGPNIKNYCDLSTKNHSWTVAAWMKWVKFRWIAPMWKILLVKNKCFSNLFGTFRAKFYWIKLHSSATEFQNKSV